MIRIQVAAGAKLEPFAYQFLDSEGDIINLAGYSGAASWERLADGTVGSVVGSVDGGTGTVTVTLPATATDTPGVVDVMLWAGNGTYRLDGERWRVLVSDPPGSAPSI